MSQAGRPPSRDTTLSTADEQESKELMKTLGTQGIADQSTTSFQPDAAESEKSHNHIVHSESPESTYKLVAFEHGDPQNPYNWSRFRKVYIVVVGAILITNSNLGSSISTGSSERSADSFGVTNPVQFVLPTSLYLVGYVLGPLFFAPLSESYGRWPVTTATLAMYTAFALGCALAPTWAGLNVMRLLAGIGASAPISVVGGMFADIYDHPRYRGNTMAVIMCFTLTGALLGPIASGYVSVVSWRWAYWVQLILAGVSWPFWLLVPETYGPTLLYQRAKRLRRQTGDSSIIAPIELEKRDLRTLAVVVLTRPLRMFFLESIVLSSCVYMATVYATFYMYLQAFSIIYQGVYGFSLGEAGLTFLPIAVGNLLGGGIHLWWEDFLAKKRAQNPPPKWTSSEEYSRVTLACVAGPFMVVSIFWLAWTARSDVHWIVPVLSSIPFGIAYVLIFISLINYLVDAYKVYAASAMAASSCSRSMFGVLLPLAVPSMFSTLSVAWAVSILGFIALVLSAVPFVFLKYGDRLRANSRFCQELKRREAEKDAG